MKLFKKAKKGFTLVELVVVIAVIAILAGVSVGAYFGITESAKVSQAEQEGKAFHTALMLVANDPTNTSKATMDKNGLVVANRSALLTEISGTSGITYALYEAEPDFTAYPAVSFNNTISEGEGKTVIYETFTYYLDATASHQIEFTISTGARA